MLNVCNVSKPAAPHSPQRRQKLNLRMKSFSLDESTQQGYSGRQSAPMATTTLQQQQALIVRGSLDGHSQSMSSAHNAAFGASSSYHSSPYHSMAVMNSCNENYDNTLLIN